MKIFYYFVMVRLVIKWIRPLSPITSCLRRCLLIALTETPVKICGMNFEKHVFTTVFLNRWKLLRVNE